MFDLNRYRAILKSRVTPERYHHSLCTQRRAAELARLHGADWYRASLAGLLHDICHCDPKERQLKYLQAHGILVDRFFQEHPPVWHAACGSIFLREELRITDEAVLAAVRYHTTGRAGMTALEQVVYLADATGRDRDYPGVDELRILSEESLDAAMFASLRHTMEGVVAQGRPVLADAWEAYNHYSGAGMPRIDREPGETEDTV